MFQPMQDLITTRPRHAPPLPPLCPTTKGRNITIVYSFTVVETYPKVMVMLPPWSILYDDFSFKFGTYKRSCL
jgi:hypothetical protein